MQKKHKKLLFIIKNVSQVDVIWKLKMELRTF